MPTTVILGAGIIGLSTAYYLSHLTENEDTDVTPTPGNPGPTPNTEGCAQPSVRTQRKHEIHLVDSSPELFASASGKAAGFLAKDWFTPAVNPLGEFSFELHRQLAEDHDGRSRWGYSGSSSYSLDRDDSEDEDDDDYDEPAHPGQENVVKILVDEDSEHPSTTAQTKRGDPNYVFDETSEDDLPRWLRAKRRSLQMISDKTTTGQVDPYRLCQFLLEQCRARGVKVHHPARATQLRHDDHNNPCSETLIRLEYLEPSKTALVNEPRSSPNSQSPPPDIPFDPNRSTLLSSTESLHENGKRGPWASFSTPLDESPRPPAPRSHSDDHLTPAQDSQSKHLDIPCDSIVIAAGCWTPRVYRTLFPNAGRIPRVTALAGHSVVLKSKHWPPVRPNTLHKLAAHVIDFQKSGDVVIAAAGGDSANTSPSISPPVDATHRLASPASSESSGTITAFYPTPSLSPRRTSPPQSYFPDLLSCHAVFTSDSAGYSPEVFSRLGGEIWLGGYNTSSIPLPAIATWSAPESKSISVLVNTGKALCGDDIEIIKQGLCFRPVVPTGRPVIARMHEADLGDGVKVGGGVFVATGHGPWGISLSLGTGYVVSEMVLGRETSVDVKVLGTWEAQAL